MFLIGATPPRTPLLGRERELDGIVALVTNGHAPLVTVTGPGGVGKTRVAIAAGHNVAARLRDGGLFIPLAPVSDWRFVPAAMAHAAGLRDKPDETAADQLPAYLQQRAMLLVLDNVEQVTGIAPFLADLLRTCPDLQLLVTSRRPLRIQEEHEFPLGPLSLPEAEPAPSTAALAENAAVHLFVERSQAVRPGFVLSDSNASDVAAICRRLDGLPLALELGAARSRHLPPAALLARLDARLSMLTGGGPDRPERHQTMRHAIAWSYDLLTLSERDLFRRLAVFSGGIPLAAAEAMARPAPGAPATAMESTLDQVGSLVDASLLLLVPGAQDELRVAMLETIREFGLEQLRARGEADHASELHARYFLRVAEEAAVTQRGAGQAEQLSILETEQENLRAALTWAGAEPDRADMLLRLAVSLFWYWYLRGHFSEGRHWLEIALAATLVDPSPLRAGALCAASVLAYRQGDYAAGRTHLLLSVSMCHTLRDMQPLAHALHFLAVSPLLHPDQAALVDVIPQSVAQFRATGDRWALATALSAFGVHALVRERYDDAAETFAESETLCREAGDTWGLARVLHYRGELSRHRGDAGTARAQYEESLSLLEALDHRFSAATVLHNLGYVAQEGGDTPGAMRCFADALEQHIRHGNQNNVAHCLGGIAGIAGSMGRLRPAAHLFGAASGLLTSAGASVWPIDRPAYERNLNLVRVQLGEATFTQAFTVGHERPLEESLAEARHEAALVAARARSEEHLVLSPRQQEILHLLSVGKSDREIGEALGIGRRTVETHIAAIYAKLGAHNRAEAAATAVRLGLI